MAKLTKPFVASPFRLYWGFLLAPLIPILVATLWPLWSGRPPLLAVLPLFMLFAYAPALIVGIPAYLGLRHLLRPTLVTTSLTGGVVACSPWLLVLLLGGGSASARSGDWAAIVGGANGIAGVLALGSLGGAIFWLVVVWHSRTAGQDSPDKLQLMQKP